MSAWEAIFSSWMPDPGGDPAYRAAMESVVREEADLLRRGGVQHLDAAPRVGQPDEVGPHFRDEQRHIIALGELYGLQTVVIHAPQHPTEAFRSWP